MTDIQYVPSAIDASGCIGTAWEMIKQKYWTYFGVSFLGLILCYYLYCISWFLMGPILGGIFLFVLTDLRGEPVEFGMMFKGFEKFMPLMWAGLLQGIPQVIGQLLGFMLNFAQVFLTGLDPPDRRGDLFAPDDAGLAIAGGILIFILIVVIVMLIFAIIWRIVFFSIIPLVVEFDLNPMDALKLSARAGWANAGGIIVLSILEGLVGLLGALLCGVGILFISMPIMFTANALAYRQIFPYTGRQINMGPPPPNVYGSSFGSGLT